MRVRFYIEKRRGEGGELLTRKRPVFMTAAFRGIRVRISTEKFVDLQWWDSEQQRVRRSMPEAMVINRWLDELEATALRTWKVLQSEMKEPEASDFRKKFASLRPRFSEGFFDVLYLFLEDGKERWNNATFRKMRHFYDSLRKFRLEKKLELNFASIDEDFLWDYVSYLKEADLSPGSIYDQLNSLTWFLNWAGEQNYHYYTEFRKFKKLYRQRHPEQKKSSKRQLFLQWDELMPLYHLKLNHTREERVRDLFCLMCFTGQSFQQLTSLRKEDVERDTLWVSGARQRRKVPLHRYASEIIQNYESKYYKDNKAFPTMTLVTFNKYLPIVGKKAGLHRKVLSVKEEVQRELWQELRSAIAVHTFIANALRLEIAPEVISTYTGVRNDARVKAILTELSVNEIKKFNEI